MVYNYISFVNMLVKEVMTKNPITINKEMSVYEAAMIYKTNKIGCLIILEDSKCIGILTERDIIERTICDKKSAENTEVKDIMTKKIITIHNLENLDKAIDLMISNNIKKLPVTHNNQIIGIITATDISRARPDLSTRFIESWVKPIWND